MQQKIYDRSLILTGPLLSAIWFCRPAFQNFQSEIINTNTRTSTSGGSFHLKNGNHPAVTWKAIKEITVLNNLFTPWVAFHASNPFFPPPEFPKSQPQSNAGLWHHVHGSLVMPVLWGCDWSFTSPFQKDCQFTYLCCLALFSSSAGHQHDSDYLSLVDHPQAYLSRSPIIFIKTSSKSIKALLTTTKKILSTET